MKNIIFDVDGVLFNDRDKNGNFLWTMDIEEKLGLHESHLKKIFSSEWLNVITGKRDTHDFFTNILQSIDGCGVTADQFIDFWLSNDSYINHGVLDIARQMPHPVFMGTNQEHLRAAHLHKMIGQHFQGMFTSGRIGFAKPEPEFYLHIEQALQCPPAQIFFIDDSEKNTAAAQDRGWNAYHFTGDVEGLKNFLKV